MSEVNYNDGKWHGWNGGECPVHPESEVEMVWPSTIDNTTHRYTRRAGSFVWKVNVNSAPCVFRVVKEHKEPRDFWIGNDAHLGLPDIRTVETKGYIHVREVM